MTETIIDKGTHLEQVIDMDRSVCKCIVYPDGSHFTWNRGHGGFSSGEIGTRINGKVYLVGVYVTCMLGYDLFAGDACVK